MQKIEKILQKLYIIIFKQKKYQFGPFKQGI